MQILNKSTRTYMINDVMVKPNGVIEIDEVQGTNLVETYKDELIALAPIVVEEKKEEAPKPKKKAVK